MHSNSIRCPKILPSSAPVLYWLSHLTCISSMKTKNGRKTLIFAQLNMSRYKQHFFAIIRRILMTWPLTYLLYVVWPQHPWRQEELMENDRQKDCWKHQRMDRPQTGASSLAAGSNRQLQTETKDCWHTFVVAPGLSLDNLCLKSTDAVPYYFFVVAKRTFARLVDGDLIDI